MAMTRLYSCITKHLYEMNYVCGLVAEQWVLASFWQLDWVDVTV